MTGAPPRPVSPDDIEQAAARIAPYIRETPVDDFPLADRNGQVLVKAEHLQVTGSFKRRGAANRMLLLGDDDRRRGVVTASSGNHGIAVATVARDLDVACRVFVSRHASPAKVRVLRAIAEVVEVDDDDSMAAELAARADAASSGRPYLSPYNDPLVIAGQGTVAHELTRQIAQPAAVVVSVGGGGLVSGIGTWVRHRWPGTLVVGASPANDPAMAASVEAGRIVAVDARPTLSDGTAGGVEPGAITFELCRDLVDRWILVDEAAIADGVRQMVDRCHQLVEGAAAVALAAATEVAGEHPDATVVAISCGANIDRATLVRVLGAGTGDR